MASEKSDAIVLKVVAWSETSSIVTLLTRDFGRISAVAKGARRLKSPFESALDLLALCRIVFIPKSHDSLDILTEAKLTRRFRSGSKELQRLYGGYYVAELLLSITEPGQNLTELFELADATLKDLDEGLETGPVLLRFELQSLRLLGLQPSFSQCAACGTSLDFEEEAETKTSDRVAFSMVAGGVLCSDCLPGQRQIVRLQQQTMRIMDRYARADWRDSPLLTIPSSVRGEVRGSITKYLTTVLDRRLQMHSFLEDLAR